MTITREQLEKAAKAAGLPLGNEVGEYSFATEFPNGDDRLYRRNANGTASPWNPLHTHGHLLDLAMACEIDIMPSSDEIKYFTKTKYGGTQRCGKFVDCQDFPTLAEVVILAACEQFDAKGGE